MWEWTLENPGWTSVIAIMLFLCLVYAPALLIAVIPRRRDIVAKAKKNMKSAERKIEYWPSEDGKFIACIGGEANGCSCLMVSDGKAECCHSDVVAAAKRRASMDACSACGTRYADDENCEGYTDQHVCSAVKEETMDKDDSIELTDTQCCECGEPDIANISTRFGWLCPNCVDSHFAASASSYDTLMNKIKEVESELEQYRKDKC